MNIVIPGYQKTLLNNDMGRIVLVVAIIMQFIGFLIIRRIINIRI
jgi:tight adherence protein B